MFVVSYFHFSSRDTLTSKKHSVEVMSANLSFIFDSPIIYKTVKYTDQSDNGSLCVLVFKTVGSSLIGRLKI